jgi:hypothetical protein
MPTSGNQNGVVLGASNDDQLAFRGLIDEARAFTFAAGQFSLTNLLYPSASATTPSIVTQPADATVWDGGAVHFTVQAATSPSLTYQWQRNGTPISGATNSSVYLPSVTRSADDGSLYRCLLTNTITGGFTTSSNALLTVVPVETNHVASYHGLVTGEPSLVAYFPVDNDSDGTLSNLKFPANAGTLEANASYESRTDRAFGQRAIDLDRSQNVGAVVLSNNPAYSFPGGSGTFEAVVYMADLGVYTNTSTWTYPTIFSVGEADRSSFQLLLGVSKTGDGLVYSDGSTITNWSTTRNLVGRFAHIAYVFDQTAGITAYLDGRSLGTQGSFAPSVSSSPAWIGSAGSSTNDFLGDVWNGTIDEIALYTNALSANTIVAHYSMLLYGTNTSPLVLTAPGPVTLLAGAANRTAVFSVEAEGTFPLSYQWNSNGVPIAGATSNLFSILNAIPAYSANYSVTVSNSAGTTNVGAALTVIAPSGYTAAITADHPVSYWRLGEHAGTTALDSWGTHNGSYLPGTSYGLPGALGSDSDTSVSFDGLTGEMQVPYSADLNPSSAFTIEAWVKPLESPPSINPAGVLASLNFNSGRSGWLLYQFNTGWNLRMGDSSGYTFNQSGSTVIQPNSWYYLAAVYDGANATLYLNGSVETTGPVSSFNPNDSAPLEVGAASAVGRFVKAQIDEVAFYNTALSAGRIQAHYSAAAGEQRPTITITKKGANLELSWPDGGVLYQADDILGQFTVVSGATSPYQVTPTAAKKFYLLRAQ